MTTTKRKTTTTRRKSTSTRSTKTTPATAEAPVVDSAEIEAPEAEITASDAADANPMVRKKELIDRVVALSGMKKKDVKPVVEATLAVLGEALSKQEHLNLQPLGRVQVKRAKDLEKGEVLTARIRRSGQSTENDPVDPLAEAAE